MSASTVSRILNGTAKVAPEKREAVEAAIRRLNFKPNLFARSLKTGITMTVGVLTQAIESQFYSRALKGIEMGLAESGHSSIIVSGHWNADADAASLKLLTSRRVDGVIILTGNIADSEVLAVAQQQPVVITERRLEARMCAPSTWTKSTAATWPPGLLALGHTRIAHLAGVDNRPDAHQRYLGYLQAHEEAGVTPNPAAWCAATSLTRAATWRPKSCWTVASRSFAIFCANDDRPWARVWRCTSVASACPRTCPWWVLTTCPCATT